MKSKTYLTTSQLAARINYTPQYIREGLLGRLFQEGIHYFRPFGGRKILFVWEEVEKEMLRERKEEIVIPLAVGGICHG